MSIWLGPPVIHKRMTARFDRRGVPARDASARCRNSPGSVRPARPARLALRKFRREAIVSPSWASGWKFARSRARSRVGGHADDPRDLASADVDNTGPFAASSIKMAFLPKAPSKS